MEQNSNNNQPQDGQQQQCPCPCTATANLALMRKEMERYKAMFEREKEQFEEFQRYSKELETEMELELKQRDRKLAEMDGGRRRMTQELEMLKNRGEQQRQEQHQTEEHMKQQMGQMRDQLVELRQKLRAVEQSNDDMERRERINSQQLVDIRARYDQCLERLALFEAGMIGPDAAQQNMQQPLSPAFSSLLHNGNAEETFNEMGTDEEHGQSLMATGIDGSRLSTPNSAVPNRSSISSSTGAPPSLQHMAAHLAANRKTNKLIDSMLRKVDAFESQFFRHNGIGSSSGAPSTSSTPTMMPINGYNNRQYQQQQNQNGST